MSAASVAGKAIAGTWAVVTGASRGIGRAMALALAREKTKLVLVARNTAALGTVSEECKSQGAQDVLSISCDVSKSDAVQSLFETVRTKCGFATVLVNAAGVLAGGSVKEGDPDAWETAFAVNVHAPMRLTRLFSPLMAENGGGAIINIGSIAAIEPMKAVPAYAATKHALRGWSTSCYDALRNDNIKVCLINPAFVNTDMVNTSPNVIPERMLQPEDIADVMMLCFNTTSSCVPSEVTLRLTLSAYKS